MQFSRRVARNSFSLALFLFLFTAVAEDKPKVFRAGAATSNITPWMGLLINGNMHNGVVSNVHDELHARALVLDDGDMQIAMVVVDNCLITRDIFDAAKEYIQQQTGIHKEHVLISATHAHSAPAATAIFETDIDPDYIRFLTVRIADAVIQASRNLAPAKIGWGVGSVPQHVFNRRWKMKLGTPFRDPFLKTNDTVQMNPGFANPNLLEPAGPTDPEVSFVAVQSIDGKPLALLANYSLHYVGGVPGNTASADYYGAFCDRIGELLNVGGQSPQFVALMANGTSGNINNANFREPPKKQASFEQIKIVANDVAQEVLRVYKTIQFRDSAPLKMTQREIKLGVRMPDKYELMAAHDLVDDKKIPFKTVQELYARESILLAQFPEEVPLLLQTIRIGELAIASVPCEVFVETGLALKKQSPFKPTFTIELANGYNGYLPTPEHHKLGGYETWRARSSYLEVNAEPKIFTTLMEMLNNLK